ncbi:COX15/CtaA family protein [Garicola koreensis]|uniref:Cytochrome c oxidase assembly protein subunit 15 n=1 Tax=Garicola koreensis TaxID=1262554 RepID=A0A7W5TUB5_9MICC|nr:COX15/CtaA family protein [Garicola koreensis]MBB3666984.1 cytochrome c oxidase assembly protein subunit 15 [Garicola koreensis]
MISKLPTRITTATKVLAWATLISNIGIILTGGAVRLTASGLGCPEWPRCTAESWVNTPEMGVHGVIEFGNRLLTYVLIAISVAMFLAVVRLWRTHRSLVIYSLVIGFGIPLQGVIGGITVWTDLNPWVVGLHFILSAGLVMVATMLRNRVALELKHQGTPGKPLVDGERDAVTTGLTPIILLAGWAAVVLGTIVTGTGPHAGDPGSPRHEFTPELVTRLHVVPVYILCAAAIVIVIRQRRLAASPAQQRAGWFLVTVIVFQAALGYVQHLTGLPILLVGLHMLGAALTIVASIGVHDRYRSRYTTRGLTTESGLAQPRTTEPRATV